MQKMRESGICWTAGPSVETVGQTVCISGCPLPRRHAQPTPHSWHGGPQFAWLWHNLSPTKPKRSPKLFIYWIIYLLLLQYVRKQTTTFKALGFTSLHSSTRMKKRSNLDMMGADMLTFCFKDLARLYLPSMGLAAAKIDVRAFKVA